MCEIAEDAYSMYVWNACTLVATGVKPESKLLA